MKTFLLSTCFLGILSAGPLRPQVDPVTLPDDDSGNAIGSFILSSNTTTAAAPAPPPITIPASRASIAPNIIIPVDSPEPGTLPAVGLAIGCLVWKLRSGQGPKRPDNN